MKPELKIVNTRRDLKKFVLFPFDLYKDDPLWVPPLIGAEMKELDRRKNPAFEHCESVFFLASIEGIIVGRIAGIINHKYIELWQHKTARFYWFDFIDDPEVSGALLSAVETWAKEKGMEDIWGPMGCTTFERQGMLVEGYSELPTLTSAYNAHYYPAHLEMHGYVKECDYVDYFIHIPDSIPEKVNSLSEAVLQRYHLHMFKYKSRRELENCCDDVFKVLNAAYKPLHGFVQLSNRQVEYFKEKFLPVVQPEFFYAVMDEDERMVGFILAMPSLSRAMQKAGGRLLPLGFIHIRKALKNPEKIDFLLVGVLPEYQNKGIYAILMNYVTRSSIDHKLQGAETNGMLEDNFRVLNFNRYFEAELHKKKRIYRKNLSG